MSKGRSRTVVSLSVHRNTARKRKEHQTSRSLVSDARQMAQAKDVDGYAIVAWNRDTDANVSWSWTNQINCSVMPEFVKGALQRKISMLDNEG